MNQWSNFVSFEMDHYWIIRLVALRWTSWSKPSWWSVEVSGWMLGGEVRGGGLICAIIELTKSNHLRPPPTNLWAARPGIDGKSSLNRTPNWKFGFFHEVGCGVPVLSLSFSLSRLVLSWFKYLSMIVQSVLNRSDSSGVIAGLER